MMGFWTIGELAMAVQQALASTAYCGQQSARVREVPDRRTIRYYTTIGLVDKPSEMRGRTAYYSHRHLLQLVAIKRLQSQGKSLVEIQTILAGAGESTLARWSALPEDFPARFDSDAPTSGQVAPEEPVVVMEVQPGQRADFWSAAPGVHSPPVQAPQRPATIVATALHLKVMDNVTLVLEGVDAGVLDAETLSRLQPVLQDLKNALERNGGTAQGARQYDKLKKQAAEDTEREQQ